MCFDKISAHKVVSARMPKVSSFKKNASEDRITLLKNLYFHGKFLQLQKCSVDIKQIFDVTDFHKLSKRTLDFVPDFFQLKYTDTRRVIS